MTEAARERLDARPVFERKARLPRIAELDDGVADGEHKLGVVIDGDDGLGYRRCGERRESQKKALQAVGGLALRCFFGWDRDLLLQVRQEEHALLSKFLQRVLDAAAHLL